MKFLLSLLCAGVVAATTLGCQCGKCGRVQTPKTAGHDQATCCCQKALAGIPLSADQKSKLAELKSACADGQCSPENCRKTSAAISALLDDEQKVAYQKALASLADQPACP